MAESIHLEDNHGLDRRQARRLRRRIARRRHAQRAENDQRVAAGRLPAHWVALDTCPCGRVAWLEEGANAQEREAFDLDSSDHTSYCDCGVS